MLQLLPPVCRDCGRSADETALNAYLDFQLCSACIGKREREVLQVDRPRRKPAPKKAQGKKAGGGTQGKKTNAKADPKTNAKADAKKGGGSRRRR